MDERINPIRITDKDTGDVYELDFNRDSITFAEGRGFKLGDVGDFPQTKFRELFYYAFRMNHKRLSLEKVDKIYDKLGGLTGKMLERLVELYQQALAANSIQDEEELEKNVHVAVEF